LKNLEHAVITGKKAESVKYANQALSDHINPVEAIDMGLIKGMIVVGDRYAEHQYFLPQVLLAADAMYAALDVLLGDAFHSSLLG
jgi:methanogenic corrinoid protein MtbC1